MALEALSKASRIVTDQAANIAHEFGAVTRYLPNRDELLGRAVGREVRLHQCVKNSKMLTGMPY